MNHEKIDSTIKSIVLSLTLFAFFMSQNIVRGLFTFRISMYDKDIGLGFFLITLIAIAALCFSFFYYPDYKDKMYKYSLALLTVLTLIFWIEAISQLSNENFASVSMGFAPFYLLVVTIGAFVLKQKSSAFTEYILKTLNNYDRTPSNKAKPATLNAYDELDKLKSLFDKGILTEEEYTNRKEILLKKIAESD